MSFRLRTAGWQGPSSSIAKVWRVKKKNACQTTRSPWGLGLYTPVALTSFFSFPCGSKKIVFETGLHMATKLQLRTLRRNVVRRLRKVGRGPRGGRFTFRKSEHQARHSQFAHWLSRWPAGLVRDRSGPSIIQSDARGPTKPNFQRPDRAGQKCKCRLVCEWVCTVTSVSVRIEKRANCAKNNKPKSGGLFLVNARPFPEHSSSRATFSAGRAWLEATRQQARLPSVETNTSDTHPSARSWNNHAWNTPTPICGTATPSICKDPRWVGRGVSEKDER